MRILLVEDDPASVEILNRYLTDQHYVVDTVNDGETGWRYASTYEYDLLVLDVVLPQLDGISLCQRLRAEGYTTPIMLLTAQDSSTSKIIGLDAGADDYVVKPFDPAEWIARIRALLRRGSTNPLPILTWGQLWLNQSTCEVTYDGKTLTLSAKEYALLELFLRESHHVFSNEEILESLWASDEFPVEATVRSHMRRLRQKLVEAGAPADLIATAHGRGYYLKPLTSTAFANPAPSYIVPSDRSAKPDQEQYLEMLHNVWLESQPRIQEHLQLIWNTVEKLRYNQLTPELQKQANHSAHTLAGTLGTLGQLACMKQAQEIEQWLHEDIVLAQEEATSLSALVQSLRDEIVTVTAQLTAGVTPTPDLGLPLPKLLLVDPAQTSTQEWLTTARQMGFKLIPLSSYPEALTWLNSNDAKTRDCQLVSGLILGLPNGEKGSSALLATALPVLDAFIQNCPAQPTLVVAQNLTWGDRLEIVRRGGDCILPRSASPQAVLKPLQQLYATTQHHRGKRVMLVDDDPVVLKTLPSQLQSCGLEVSTLNDPQQFWNLLEVVQPDVVVLDIKMPLVNGLELCQVLRSDPNWQQLPILFLSVVSDGQTQSRAFAVGADDYVCKPVSGKDLANRIFNRLQRVQAWRSAS